MRFMLAEEGRLTQKRGHFRIGYPFNETSLSGTDKNESDSSWPSVKSISWIWVMAASKDARKYPISPIRFILSQSVRNKTPVFKI